MAYEIEEIKMSQKIFYHLIEFRQLSKETDKELYEAYNEREEIKNLVQSQAEEAECQLERFSNVIYLVPKEKNEVFGFSKAELRNALCKSGANDKDYYLSQFVIMTLLVEFYDANSRSAKSRTYMRGGDLLNCIAERLKEGAARAAQQTKEEALESGKQGIAFETLLQTYEALKSEEKGSRSRTTKEGFLYHILNFLQKQALIVYVEADDIIQTTEKLDHFMDWNLLNKNHYERVLRILGVIEDE